MKTGGSRDPAAAIILSGNRRVRAENMIHEYKNNGYNIVLDVNSGAVHVTDEIVYDLIPLMERNINASDVELAGLLSGRYRVEEVHEAAQEIKELSKETATKQEQVKEVADPLVGTYFCNRTHDTYVFKSDKTGFFTIQGGSPSTFTWKRSGNNATIVYEVFGQQTLKFDQKVETLTEKSESFGILTFYKQ